MDLFVMESFHILLDGKSGAYISSSFLPLDLNFYYFLK